MSFDREVRATNNVKGFLDRLHRRQYISEISQNTRDTLETHIKKIRAEKHINEIPHFNDNVNSILLGCDSVFEPDGREVMAFQMQDAPASGTRTIKYGAGQSYQYIIIPDNPVVYNTKYKNREAQYMTPDTECLEFDGIFSLVNCGKNSIWTGSQSKFTFSFWATFKETTITPSFRTVISTYDVNGMTCFQSNDDPNVIFVDITNGANYAAASSSAIKEKDAWYFIVCTYDAALGSANLKIYVDGVQGSTTGDLTDTLTFNNNLLVSNGDHYGKIRDFRYWKGTALSSAQILNLYNGNDELVTAPDYWLPLRLGQSEKNNLSTVYDNLNHSSATIEGNAKWVGFGDFVWIRNTGVPSTAPVMVRTGYSLGLNCDTLNGKGQTVRRFGQFLTWDKTPRLGYKTFDGATTISEADKSSLDLSNFTIVCRFRTTKNYSGGRGYLCSKGNDSVETAGQNLNYLLYIGTGNDIVGGFEESTGTDHKVGGGSYEINDGFWHFAAVTYDGSKLRVYVDGILVGSTSETATPDTNNLALYIGSHNGADQFFTGDIDEFYVFNTGLNPHEIWALCNYEREVKGSNIVYYNGLASYEFDGIDDFVSVTSTASLQLNNFAVACRFKTSHDFSSGEGYIVNKGGTGSDAAGENDNYSIKMNTSNKISAGFEETTGTDHYATSSLTYNDGLWHLALVTYDGATIRLYIDGMEVASHSTSTTPETNTKDLVIARNSRTSDRFFRGSIDDVYVWNVALTALEVEDLFNFNRIPQTAAIVYTNLFGEYDGNDPDFKWTRQNFSESFWIYPTNLADSGSKRVVKLCTHDANNYYSYMIDNSDNKLFVEFVLGGTPARLQSASALAVNTWHHVVVTYEHAIQKVVLRVNDTAGVSSSKTGHAPISYNKPCYGSYPNSKASESFKGIIDAIVYYKHWQSLFFDGSNDYVNCGNDASLWSQSLTKFSFSFWIFPTAGWDGNGRRVVAHNSGSTAQAFSCLISDTVSNRIQFRIRNAANTAIDSINDTLQLNQWNHIVCVYDNSLGSANLKIYVNGVVGTNANLTEAINLSTALILADSSNDFAGYMKDFRWWTTKALSTSEIDDIFNNRSSAPVPDYWLLLEEGSGNPLDAISKTKTGTLQNGATWQTTIGTKVLQVPEMTSLFKYNTKYGMPSTRDPDVSGAAFSG